jgi:hypothetical protein
VKPEDVDELITMVEAGQEVRVRYPGGLEVTLNESHIDDLHLAKAASAYLDDAYQKLTKNMQSDTP